MPLILILLVLLLLFGGGGYYMGPGVGYYGGGGVSLILLIVIIFLLLAGDGAESRLNARTNRRLHRAIPISAHMITEMLGPSALIGYAAHATGWAAPTRWLPLRGVALRLLCIVLPPWR
jgi:hypothetical protein